MKIKKIDLQKDLKGVSPLEMSKVLINYELADQHSSLEVLEKIYDEFESKTNIIDSLVNPMLLSIADGLVKHPKLNGTFRKTNITPSRLVKEVNAFHYEEDTQRLPDEDYFLTQAQKSHYSTETRDKFYDTKSRTTTEKEQGIIRDETITYTDTNGEVKSKKTATIQDYITGEDLDLTKQGAQQKGIKSADMDHVNPINDIRKRYKNNPFLYRDDLEELVGLPENESYVNSSLNQSKGDMSWSEYIKKNPEALSKKEQKKALKLEADAKKAQEKKATELMAKNAGLKGLGDIIILLLKPLWYELKDMFANGVTSGFNTEDKIEAFILRMKRMVGYVKTNVLPTLGDSLKDIISTFIGVLVNSIIGAFTGIFKKIVQIISDGFIAIKNAFEIMMKPSSEMSSAQKADAITKIIATAIVPILTFAFEDALSKIPVIGDIATIIVSGIATTLVVWVLDEIDLFSVKDEKRLARVKEIFALRIEAIKQNTDIFEKQSLEILAKQKMQFEMIASRLSQGIEKNEDVNSYVMQMADFMQVDLEIKSTNDFMELLRNNEKVVI